MGQFTNWYSAEYHIIIVDIGYSPAALLNFPAKDHPNFQELPRYRSWSDITSAIWKHNAGLNAGGLRFIWQHHIANSITKRFIEQAAGVGPQEFDHPYPGIEIKPTAMDDYIIGPKPGQMKFEALLGSPNGVGVAWLLITRRETFPLPVTIKSVQIFTTLRLNGKRSYQMLFTIG